MELTNEERARAGVPTLRTSGRLAEAAALHAGQLAEAGRLDHTLPEARYPTLADRLAAVGYTWAASGENLAFGQPTAAAVVEAWMGSAPHRANILNATFVDIGAAIANDRTGRPYYVQVFGTPR